MNSISDVSDMQSQQTKKSIQTRHFYFHACGWYNLFIFIIVNIGCCILQLSDWERPGLQEFLFTDNVY